jgi:general secretion pathway protein K
MRITRADRNVKHRNRHCDRCCNWQRHAQRGGALLAVLWLSAGLSAIALSVSSNVRSETDRVATEGEGLRASYLAAGALERGILWVQWGSNGLIYTNPDGSTRFWRPNQSRMTMAFPSGDAIVEVIPEGAKLNINTASADDLYRVVFAVSGDAGRARLITDAVVDWRSPVSSPSAFDSYYFTLGPTFRARHASFLEIEELLLVQGMSPELFYGNYTTGADGRLYARGGLRDCLSVWGSMGPFDLNTSSPALMEAMGVDGATVAAVVARRQTRPFASPGELAELGMQTPRFTILPGITIYTLRATARLRRGDGTYSDTVRTAAVTIKLYDPRRAPQSLEILRWYDDAWSQAAIPPYPGMPVTGGNVPGQPNFAGPAAPAAINNGAPRL